MSYPPKGPADYLELGDWNVICSMCGRKKKASWLVKNWQGMWRCPEHNEGRQPQDFVRGVAERETPPWVQPPPADTFVDFGCTPASTTAIPGDEYASPGCAVPGYISPYLT